MSPSPIIRPAKPSDAPSLAKLIDIAGEGIPRWLWSQSCADGQDPLDVGAERARRTEGGFSYRNAVVAERDGRPIGMVLSYAIDAAPDDDPDDLPAP
ncbi:MAG: GNAT family N-acetyltransferase, partial [Rhizobiales bacterium]|nr:GNAT family N-acetyltransferase [Hyphomicrobiales bacterium]